MKRRRDEARYAKTFKIPTTKVDGGFQSLYDFLGLDEASPTPEPPKDRFADSACHGFDPKFASRLRQSLQARALEFLPQLKNLDSDCLQGAAGYPQQQYPLAEAKARVRNTVTSCFTLQEAISHEEHKEVEEVIEPALDKGTLDKQ